MNLAIVGLQWGDEGKGKIVDYLARSFDINARFQGGSNAGHTVRYEGEKVIFHQVPCGVLNRNTTGVIGGGCVLDPKILLEEIGNLTKYDPAIRERIKISKFCHLIMPYHILIDEIREGTKQAIGTTKKGIGVAYEDKYGRTGLRVGDLYNIESFEKKLCLNISRKNLVLMDVYHAEPLSDSEIFDLYMKYADELKPMVADDTRIVSQAMNAGKNVLFEGAQGAMLDVDYGTYPYVTSSHTVASSVGIGLGIPPYSVESVVGVAKAYTTRVGQGPFPTEDSGELGSLLRESGAEFGSTTGRPRRCGPFDAAVVRYAARISGVKEMILTKLDVLAGFDKIRVAIGYENSDELDPFATELLVPRYIEVPGFKEDISGVRSPDDLPSNVLNYIHVIEENTGIRVSHISLGPERDAIVEM
ncbi:MAG: adenylosuccinate synthase [candidate division WOR-3 bacterium]|nr:adenylosuccinate synthase [candidate division WOR-3 bacterium]